MSERPIELAGKAVEAAGTRDATAHVTAFRNAFVRFGSNRITQNQDSGGISMLLTVGDGARKASVTFEDVSRQGMERAAAKARELLKASPEDPEYVPPPGPGQIYPGIDGAEDPQAAECPVEQRMRAVKGIIEEAARHGLEAGGICENSRTMTAVATSTGNRAEHSATAVSISFTMDRGRASSYRALRSESWNIDWRTAAETVAKQALDNRGQTEPAPGDYDLILEPQAVSNLLVFIYFTLDARRADEGLTVFSGMEGKKLSGPKLTVRSDPDGRVKGVRFNSEGLPARKSLWIEKGVLKQLPCDRFWAGKTGREPAFIPDCLEMDGGSETLEDMIAATGRGLLIRRFWYIRFVDQKTLKLTGMTRDGVFRISDGRVAGPVPDFRWNWRPLELFRNLEAAGVPERTGFIMAPPVRITRIPYPCV
jgi:predicted Zn-dependent protease